MNQERIDTYRQMIRQGATPNILPDYVEEVLSGLTGAERAAYIERALRRG